MALMGPEVCSRIQHASPHARRLVMVLKFIQKESKTSDEIIMDRRKRKIIFHKL